MDRTGQDRTGQDRTGQDRTGQDRTGQDRTGQDRRNIARNGKRTGAAMNLSTKEKEAFHDLMITVQVASDGQWPRTIVHFMEEALSADTKVEILNLYQDHHVDEKQIAAVMISAGHSVDNESTEPVEEYIKRELRTAL